MLHSPVFNDSQFIDASILFSLNFPLYKYYFSTSMPKLGQSFARIFIKFGYLWYAVSRLLNLLVQISQIYLHFPSSSNVLSAKQ